MHRNSLCTQNPDSCLPDEMRKSIYVINSTELKHLEFHFFLLFRIYVHLWTSLLLVSKQYSFFLPITFDPSWRSCVLCLLFLQDWVFSILYMSKPFCIPILLIKNRVLFLFKTSEVTYSDFCKSQVDLSLAILSSTGIWSSPGLKFIWHHSSTGIWHW